jgi:hypothetical protein
MPTLLLLDGANPTMAAAAAIILLAAASAGTTQALRGAEFKLKRVILPGEEEALACYEINADGSLGLKYCYHWLL